MLLRARRSALVVALAPWCPLGASSSAVAYAEPSRGAPGSPATHARSGAAAVDTIRIGAHGLRASTLPLGRDSTATYLEVNGQRRLVATYIEEKQAIAGGLLIVGRNVSPAGATLSLDSLMLAADLSPRWHSDTTPGTRARVTFEANRMRGSATDSGGTRVLDAPVAAGAFDYSMASQLVGYLPLRSGYAGVLATHDIRRGAVYTPFQVVGEEAITRDGASEDSWKVTMQLSPTTVATRWIGKRTKRNLRVVVELPGRRMVVE